MDPETRPLSVDSAPIPGYRLIAKMGAGQFGQVWRAKGPGGIEVALKFLKMDDAGGAREFKAVQRIKTIHHPHLVALFASWIRTPDGHLIDDSTIAGDAEKGVSNTRKTPELGDNETLLFDESWPDVSPEGADTSPAAGDATPTPVASFVKSLPPGCELIVAMELGDKTLEDRLDECPEGGIPREELLDYMEEAAKGIDHLKQNAMIHGDIKPTNLLLVGGAVKLCDYGLARYFDDERMTIAAMGTPRYAAPELIKGHPAATSDQYCLAITYRDLRTGLLEGPPSLSDLPTAEREVLEKAASPDPEARYSSCREMVEELRTGRRKRRLWPRLLATAVLLTAIAIAATIGVRFLPQGVSIFPSPSYSSAEWKQQFDDAIQDNDWEMADNLLKQVPSTLLTTELDDARILISEEWKTAFEDCIANGELGNAGKMAESFPSVISEDTRSNSTLALQDAWRGAFNSFLEERSFGQAEKLLEDPVAGIGGQEIGKLGDDLREKWRSSYRGSVEMKNVTEAERILNEAPRTVSQDLPKLREQLCDEWRGWMDAAIIKRNAGECDGLLDDPPKGVGYDELSKWRQQIQEMGEPPTLVKLAASIRKTLASSRPSEARKILNSAESAQRDHAEYKIWDNLINLHDQSTSHEDCINAIRFVKTACPLPVPKFETLSGSDFWNAWTESSNRLVGDPETSWQDVDVAIVVAEHLAKCVPASRPDVAKGPLERLCKRMVELRLRSETDPDNTEAEAYDRLRIACKKLSLEDGLAGLWLIEQELKRDPSNHAPRESLKQIRVDDEWTSYFRFVKACAWKTLGEGNWAKVCEELQLVFAGTNSPSPKPIPAWMKQAAELSVDAADKLSNRIGADDDLREVAYRLSSSPFRVAPDSIYELLSRVERDCSESFPPDRMTELRKYLALAAASAGDPIAKGARQRTADLETAGDIVLSYWTFRCRLTAPIDADDERVLLSSGRTLFEALLEKPLAGTLPAKDCKSLEGVLISPLLQLAEDPATRCSVEWLTLLEAVGDFVWLHRYSDWRNEARNGGVRLCESLYSSPTKKLIEPEDDVDFRKRLASCHLKAARTTIARPAWSLEEVSSHVSAAIDLDQSLESYHLTHYVKAELARRSAKESPGEYLVYIKAALESAKEAVERVPRDSPEQTLYKVTLSGVHMLWAHYEQDVTFDAQKKELQKAVKLADEAVKVAGHRYRRNAQLALGNSCEDLAWLAAESPENNYARAIVAFREMNDEYFQDPQATVSEARCYYRMVVQSRLQPPFFDGLDNDTIKGLNPTTLDMDQEQLMKKCVEILDEVKSGDRFEVEARFYAAKAAKYLAKIAFNRNREAPSGDDECLKRLTDAWKQAKDLQLPDRGTYLFELVGYPMTKYPPSEAPFDEVKKNIADWTQFVADSDFPQQWKTDWEVFRRELHDVYGASILPEAIAVCDEILSDATQPGRNARMRILLLRANGRQQAKRFSDARSDYLTLAGLASDAASSAQYQADAARLGYYAVAEGHENLESSDKISRLMEYWTEVESAAELAANHPLPHEVKGLIAMNLAALHLGKPDYNQACKYKSEQWTACGRWNTVLLGDPASSDDERETAAKYLGNAKKTRDTVFQEAGASLRDKTDEDFKSEDLRGLLNTVFAWLEEMADNRNAAQNALYQRLKPRYEALSQ